MSATDRIPATKLRSFALEVLASAGWSEDDAAIIADALLESSLRGIDSHGIVSLLPAYARDARQAAGQPGPQVVREGQAVALVDGNRALGLRAARLAVDLALARAASVGVGAVAARNLGYLGALWWVVEPGARRGVVTLAMCTSLACVAPHGGREPLHGTNPIAVAIPHEPDPILLDMRTNALRMADYWESVKTGTPLPAGGLIDPAGRSLRELERLDEAVYLPLAGAKGYGLALLVDVLASALADGPIGRELDAENERSEVTAFFLAIDPAYFGGHEAFEAAVGRLADQAHATSPLDAERPVLLPGERSFAERRRRLAHGVPVDARLWSDMAEALAGLGLDVPTPRLGGSER